MSSYDVVTGKLVNKGYDRRMIMKNLLECEEKFVIILNNEIKMKKNIINILFCFPLISVAIGLGILFLYVGLYKINVSFSIIIALYISSLTNLMLYILNYEK